MEKMTLYEIYELGLKIELGVSPEKEITVDDFIKAHLFSDLKKEIEKFPSVDLEAWERAVI